MGALIDSPKEPTHTGGEGGGNSPRETWVPLPRKRKAKEGRQANISHFTVSYQIPRSRENEVPECVFT